jgi:DNA-binding response OmpR family regulator
MRDKPRVLVVEDEFLVRDMIAYELIYAGFDVMAAESAETALGLLDKVDGIDLLFTDIKLPGMDGWHLAEKIRARKTGLPVIYASGYPERMRLLPASIFLHKPYRPSEVLQAAAELGIKLPQS